MSDEIRQNEYMTSTTTSEILAANPRPALGWNKATAFAWLDRINDACTVAIENLCHVADAAIASGDMATVSHLLDEIHAVETLRDSFPQRRLVVAA